MHTNLKMWTGKIQEALHFNNLKINTSIKSFSPLFNTAWKANGK